MKTIKQVLEDKGYQIHSVAPGTTVYEALQKMAEHEVNQLPVVSDGRLLGAITRQRLIAIAQANAALKSA